MFEFKLQIGCLLIAVYFIIVYIKNTLQKKIPCNSFFKALLIMAPCAVIFDGATAWTVNHLEQVPAQWNLLLHGLFFISMDAVTVIIFLYMFQQTIGIHNKKQLCFLLIPAIISVIGILGFLNQLEYIRGNTTYYSMGISVIFCYASLFFHFLVIFALICLKQRTIEKKKMFSLVSYMVITICILFAQIIYPEILISSLLPTIAIIGIYMNFEDPSLKRLKIYNEDMVMGFATLVENRDNSTGGHIRRTKDYVQIILNRLREASNLEYQKVITKDYIGNVVNAAPMHDIGKIATPDYILQKPGKLTDEEYEIMKQHSAVGGEIIKETFADIEDKDYQQIAYEVARFHHEKWNGKGYPDGLKEEEIPLHARIMAIADVFDAVSAKRCYRDALPIDVCFKIIKEGAGTDFDPKLVGLFFEAKEEILKYYEKNCK